MAALLDSPCDNDDTHGPGTDTLCEGDALHTDTYLLSPSATYELYFQDDGGTYIFDTSTWTAVQTLMESYSSPSHMVWITPLTMAWFQWCEDPGECEYFSDPQGYSYSGGTCVRLVDEGYLFMYDEDCSHFINAFD